MILFDANALYGLSPDDANLDLLRALKQSGKQHVSVPWTVQEELVAQRALRHAEAHRAAESAIRDLNSWRRGYVSGVQKPFNRSAASDY